MLFRSGRLERRFSGRDILSKKRTRRRRIPRHLLIQVVLAEGDGVVELVARPFAARDLEVMQHFQGGLKQAVEALFVEAEIEHGLGFHFAGFEGFFHVLIDGDGFDTAETLHAPLGFGSIVRTLRSGEKVEIRGFGSFHTRQRRGRIGRNPKTGARVEVPPKRIPFFKPSKELRELLERI